MTKLFPLTAGALVLAGVLAAQSPAASSAPSDNRDRNMRAYVDLLRSDVQKSKAQVMGTVMQLDAGQASKFWPVYKQFEVELAGIGDQVVGLIKEYSKNYDNMNNGVADRLASKLLALEGQRTALKQKYYLKFKTATDAVTAMRFLQVENQLERIVDLQVASELPVIQGPAE